MAERRRARACSATPAAATASCSSSRRTKSRRNGRWRFRVVRNSTRSTGVRPRVGMRRTERWTELAAAQLADSVRQSNRPAHHRYPGALTKSGRREHQGRPNSWRSATGADRAHLARRYQNVPYRSYVRFGVAHISEARFQLRAKEHRRFHSGEPAGMEVAEAVLMLSNVPAKTNLFA